MKKVHITTDKTFVFRNGRQKLELSKKETGELLTQLADQLGYVLIPRPMLGNILKVTKDTSHDKFKCTKPVMPHFDPLQVYGPTMM
jgi:hypothetical protein